MFEHLSLTPNLRTFFSEKKDFKLFACCLLFTLFNINTLKQTNFCKVKWCKKKFHNALKKVQENQVCTSELKA